MAIQRISVPPGPVRRNVASGRSNEPGRTAFAMRKTPRAGATAACALAAALTASAFAIAPAPSAPPVVSARARAYPVLARVQPGGPLAARGNERDAALG